MALPHNTVAAVGSYMVVVVGALHMERMNTTGTPLEHHNAVVGVGVVR